MGDLEEKVDSVPKKRGRPKKLQTAAEVEASTHPLLLLFGDTDNSGGLDSDEVTEVFAVFDTDGSGLLVPLEMQFAAECITGAPAPLVSAGAIWNQRTSLTVTA